MKVSLPSSHGIPASLLCEKRAQPMGRMADMSVSRFRGNAAAKSVILREKTLAISTATAVPTSLRPRRFSWGLAGLHALLVNLTLLIGHSSALAQPPKPQTPPAPTVTTPQKAAAATPVAPKSVELKVTPQVQKTMACSTTSLSMALKYLGVDVSPDQLDKDVKRPVKDGTSMTALVKATKKYDRFAEVYNNAKFEDIVKHIDADHPILVLVDYGDQRTHNLYHILVVKGYSETKEGDQIKQMVKVIDPTPNAATGKQEMEFEYNRFASLFWSNLNDVQTVTQTRRVNRTLRTFTSYRKVDTGFNNVMVVLSRKDDLPKGGFEGTAAETNATWADITERLYDEQQQLEKKAEKKPFLFFP